MSAPETALARLPVVPMVTRAAHADSHGQIGNLDLACRVVTTRLRAGVVLA